MYPVIELHLEGRFKRIVLNHTFETPLMTNEVNRELIDELIELKKGFSVNYHEDRDEWDIVIDDIRFTG